jgi:hypothetical protein
MQRAAILTASQLSSYDAFKHAVLDRGWMGEGLPLHSVSSIFAGTVCALTTAPVDNVKTRLMNQTVDAAGRGLHGDHLAIGNLGESQQAVIFRRRAIMALLIVGDGRIGTQLTQMIDAGLQIRARRAEPAHGGGAVSDAAELFAGLAIAQGFGEPADGDAQIVDGILSLQTDDPWLTKAMATLRAGSPGSAWLGYALQKRVRPLSLAEVFRLEFVVSLHCAARPDFVEGIRALIIEKDQKPQWNPASLGAATPEWVEGFFVDPWSPDQHPLADLAA